MRKCCQYYQRKKKYLSIILFTVPGGSDGKESACNARDPGLIPGLGRSPGEGNGNPLQYSCLENPIDGGAWWAAVHGVAKSWTRLSYICMHSFKKNSRFLFEKSKIHCKYLKNESFHKYFRNFMFHYAAVMKEFQRIA